MKWVKDLIYWVSHVGRHFQELIRYIFLLNWVSVQNALRWLLLFSWSRYFSVLQMCCSVPEFLSLLSYTVVRPKMKRLVLMPLQNEGPSGQLLQQSLQILMICSLSGIVFPLSPIFERMNSKIATETFQGCFIC